MRIVFSSVSAQGGGLHVNYLEFAVVKSKVSFTFLCSHGIKMKNYVQHVGLTAWRKKSSLLLATALVAIILFGLHYTQSEEDNKIEENPSNDDDKAPAAVVQALIQNSNSVRFVESEQKNKLQSTERTVVVASTTRDNAIEKMTHKSVSQEVYETEQQLGIPFVNLDIKNPYVPKKRIVHLDLKGAPPKVTFLKKLLPMLKNMGATGILIGKIIVLRRQLPS